MVSNFGRMLVVGLAMVVVAGCSKEQPSPKVVSDPPKVSKTDSSENETVESKSAEADSEIDIKALRAEQREKYMTTGELEDPVRLEADGKVIDIAIVQAGPSGSGIAHAGPAIADIDDDGDNDLLVGDFPGYFWLFENDADDKQPRYVSKGKLQAGGEAAKTPVY